jgi:hypothetical protein
VRTILGEVDAMLHLAWPGVSNLWDPAHMEHQMDRADD